MLNTTLRAINPEHARLAAHEHASQAAEQSAYVTHPRPLPLAPAASFGAGFSHTVCCASVLW